RLEEGVSPAPRILVTQWTALLPARGVCIRLSAYQSPPWTATMKFPLMLLLLSLAGGIASAQVNLLPQGSFENPGVNTGWAEGFNIPNNQEFRVLSEDGKHWLRLENHDPTQQLDSVHAYVKVTPEIASLTISVR